MKQHALPPSWKWVKLKFLSQIRYGLGQPPAELDSGLPLLRATNIDHGRILTKGMIYVDPKEVPPDRDAFLRSEEILVVRSGAYTGDSAIVPREYEGAVAGYDMVVRVTHACPRYIAYGLLSIPVLKHQIDLCRMRAAQPHLNAEDLGDCVFAVPPRPEQRAIAAFLDRKTAEIDAVIAKKERLIALLQEERQALISRAVTRGLDAGAAMKDSGIPWLGEVPKHWKVCPLRRFPCIVQTGPFGSQLHAEEYVEGATPVINPINLVAGKIHPEPSVTVGMEVLERLSHQRLCRGDIVFSRRGELGRCAFVTEREEGWLCGTGCMIVRIVNTPWNTRYLSAYLSTPRLRDYFRMQSVGSIMESLSSETVLSMPVVVPPTDEQHEICYHLDRATNRIDGLVRMNADQITKLREYRQALISAAVTGQVAVPQEVAT